MANISIGLQLMLVGMVTVFAILLIVIYGSRLLIQLINKIAPEEAAPAAKKESKSDIPMDILSQAVAQLTGGKGHIVKATKIN